MDCPFAVFCHRNVNASHAHIWLQSMLLLLDSLLESSGQQPHWGLCPAPPTLQLALPQPTSCPLMLTIKRSFSQTSLPRYGQGLPASFQACIANEGGAGRAGLSNPGNRGLDISIPDRDPQTFPKESLTLVDGSGVPGWSLVLRPEQRAPFPPKCYSPALNPGITA